jgi:hypothetical protein
MREGKMLKHVRRGTIETGCTSPQRCPITPLGISEDS